MWLAQLTGPKRQPAAGVDRHVMMVRRAKRIELSTRSDSADNRLFGFGPLFLCELNTCEAQALVISCGDNNVCRATMHTAYMAWWRGVANDFSHARNGYVESAATSTVTAISYMHDDVVCAYADTLQTDRARGVAYRAN